MKHLHIVLIAALLWGCTSPEGPQAKPPHGDGIAVEFSIEAPTDIETDWEQQPMTRVTSYKSKISNTLRYVLLKKDDTRWIVDQTGTLVLDKNVSWLGEIYITDGLPPHTLSLEMRPGEYRIVAVINPMTGKWHDITPGTVAADESDPSFITPPLQTYLVSEHERNPGYLVIYREVCVAVHDFEVPKTEDLHSDGMPPIKLHARRRVGKFRFLLKDQSSPVNGFTFNSTPHTAHFLFTPQGRPFPNGIDAMGNMYYDPEKPLNELEWCMYTSATFYPSGGNNYQICQTNASVFAPFLFADPEAGELDFTLSDIQISGASGSGGFSYRCADTFERALAVDKTAGIVFRTTDTFDGDYYHPTVDIVEAVDENGQPENAAGLFDPFFEWNAASY